MDQLTGLGFGCFSKLKFPFFSQFLGIFDEFSKWKIVKKKSKNLPKTEIGYPIYHYCDVLPEEN